MLRFKGIWFKASQSYTEQIWCKSIFSSNVSPGIKLGISRTEGRAPTNCAILAAIKPHGHIKGIKNNLWKVELLSNFFATTFPDQQQHFRFDLWVATRETSLFDLFCTNVAKQVARFRCLFFRTLIDKVFTVGQLPH